MRSVRIATILILSLTVAAAERSPFVGKWEGKINDLPGVDLTIESTGGELGGVVVFYFQLRDSDGKWRVKGKSNARLLAPLAKGKTLTFEVLHHKTHGSPELGPNAKFRLELTAGNKAILHKVEDQPPPPVRLTRRR